MTDTLHTFIAAVDNKIVPIFHAIGSISPMWHAETASGDILIVQTGGGDKDTDALMMRAYFKLNDIGRYCFIDEAWTLTVPTSREHEAREAFKRGLEHHPDRVEVLVYQAEHESGSATGHRVITRPPKGKAQLGPLKVFRSSMSEGRFVGMLPQRGTVQ